MINPKEFYESLCFNGVQFYCGVPDSLLKDVCAYIQDNTSVDNHVISANEGGAISLAIGFHLANGGVPMVYMQNSGFGNALNPLLSLADPKVYGIPMLLLIGWRGEPGVKDEPQHVKQGEISETVLQTLGIPYAVLSGESMNFRDIITESLSHCRMNSTPFAILVRNGTFEPYSLSSNPNSNYELNREEALIKCLELLSDDDVVVATTGKTSRELFEQRVRLNQGHHRDFLTVGGMGHANQIALGIAMARPANTIFCFDGDGAVLMHTGSIGIIGESQMKNYKHIVFNNGAHDSVGGQPTIGFKVNFAKIAKEFNYRNTFRVETAADLVEVFDRFKRLDGPNMLEILINKGSRKNLGRPTLSTKQNKSDFQKFINSL